MIFLACGSGESLAENEHYQFFIKDVTSLFLFILDFNWVIMLLHYLNLKRMNGYTYLGT